MNNKIMKVKEKIDIDIESDLLLKILFEMNRYFDKHFTVEIQKSQKKLSRTFNYKERKLLRIYYYYGIKEALKQISVEQFETMNYSESDVDFVLNDCLKRLDTYGVEKIAASINERMMNYKSKIIIDNSEKWLDYHFNKVSKEFKYSLLVININQSDFIKHDYDFNYYCKLIASCYDDLENYRYLIIKLEGKLFDLNSNDVTWKIIYKLGIFCENFIEFKEKFFPFKRDKSVSKLKEFINSRYDANNGEHLADEFYNSISTGFKFEDCYISEEQNKIFLTYKKIKLDQRPVPCPSCMKTIESGNSFPEVFLRSYECKNPSCPDRSKSGRGKRFDEFGTYRYFKLVEDHETNRVSFDLYSKWRRDLFSETNDAYEMIINYYSWDGEKIAIYNDIVKLQTDRIIFDLKVDFKRIRYITKFEELPIFKLFLELSKMINRKTGNEVINKRIIVQNEDSILGLRRLQPGQIGAAITSPPYYNAREYSQWPTLILYLIDMMNNAAAVYDSLANNSNYLYNIGDIVNTDNVYVESNMSKKRLQLGFLSCMIFELVGFDLVGNIIWDKGQVQSKRNSTVNLYSGYVKCINCYEHVFVFTKGENKDKRVISYVKAFAPVIKINSKGENTYKHTAPFPPEMIELLRPFIDRSKYVLDPFLGSGTTVKWCKENGFKGIGFEINKDYFNLCLERIDDVSDDE